MAVQEAPLTHFGFKSLAELAKASEYTNKTLRNWIHDGVLHAVRIDGVWHTTPEEFQRAAESRQRIGRLTNTARARRDAGSSEEAVLADATA
jgi:hypothetical protein